MPEVLRNLVYKVNLKEQAVEFCKYIAQINFQFDLKAILCE